MIQAEHDKRVASAEGCGLNEKRKAQLALIKAECAAEAATPGLLTAGASSHCFTEVEFLADAPARLRVRISVRGLASLPWLAPDIAAAAAANAATAHSTAGACGGASSASGAANDDGGVSGPLPPKGNFRNCCNVCRGWYYERHAFYHQLCHRCAEHNLEKRHQTADLTGYVAVVTGGRVRIGYRRALLATGGRMKRRLRSPRTSCMPELHARAACPSCMPELHAH